MITRKWWSWLTRAADKPRAIEVPGGMLIIYKKMTDAETARFRCAFTDAMKRELSYADDDDDATRPSS